jgi:glycosyltransferase involved in cell wall biosynthesis
MDTTVVDWLRRFQKQHGRAPRVLHIGNIANNAYKNAQMLRQVGIECDVLCHSYYHIMGTPEWEDADFQGDYEDQTWPAWYKVKLGGFKRPRWFVQGTFVTCMEYLIAKNEGDQHKAQQLWEQLGRENRTLPPVPVPRWYDVWIVYLHTMGKTLLQRLRRLFCFMVIGMSQICVQFLQYVYYGLHRWYRIYVGPWGFRANNRELWEQMAMVPLPVRALLWGLSCLFFFTAVGMRKTQCLGLGYVWRGLRRWYRPYAKARGLHATSQQLWDWGARVQLRGQAMLRQLARPFFPRVAGMRQHFRQLPFRGRSIEAVDRVGAAQVRLELGTEVREQSPTLQTEPALYNHAQFLQHIHWLVDAFNTRFPNRSDRMTSDDLLELESMVPYGERVLRYYDLVQAYSTDPIVPLMLGKRPYVAFEHGTLRDFTLNDSSVCRRTALAYNMADHVFITNGDCLAYAQKIGVECYSPMLHPIDERRIRTIANHKNRLRKRLRRTHIFLCPLRHDWIVKGTDQYIRALPAIRQAIGDDFVVIMTKWGAELEKSQILAEGLGVAPWLTWWEPLQRSALLRVMKSVDVVFDQLALPHFGATAPEAIAAGVPVISSYHPTSTAWLIPEAAPILAAFDAVSIAQAVTMALDPQWLVAYRRRARDWFDTYHTSGIVMRKHLEVYGRLLDPARNPVEPTTKEREHDQRRERAQRAL